MHRSSESVGSIATALAKAQTELTNPEKSMVRTIHHNYRADNPQSFRYAPLSSGLEIVRKVLGGQQIAIAQTTQIDAVNGLINVTTTLIHTSGEWISSDWPVCQLSEISAPRRMGAALTYARRYALFTIVGIAGEDDLDEAGAESNTLKPVDPTTIKQSLSGLNSEQPFTRPIPDHPDKQTQALTNASIGPDESASLRAKLEAEISTLVATEDLEMRAVKILKAKNRLLSSDAKLLETTFALRLDRLKEQAPNLTVPTAEDDDTEGPLNPKPIIAEPSTSPLPKGRGRSPKNRADMAGSRSHIKMKDQSNTISPSIVAPTSPPEITTYESSKIRLTLTDFQSEKIDKNNLALSEPRRKRDKMHLRFVALQPCLICGRVPSDAHHLRFAQPRAMSRKTSDEFTVPLCRTHHRHNHRFGDEVAWWARSAIDPIAISQKLWNLSRRVPPN